MRCVLFFIASILLFNYIESSSFTFELPDGETRCFYADLKKNERTTIEFQVTSGGNFDIDVTLRDPSNNPVKVLQREQYDFFDYTAGIEGEYELCFSNEFSSVTHKIVYMNWDLESANSDTIGGAPLTMVDSTVYAIHENLRNAAAAQTRVRLQEATSRSFVEALNERVTWGSCIHVAIILIVAVGQVYLLRSLFNSPSSAAISSRNRIIPTVGY
ncbi:Transmembrane emp24 domain-containing protein 7 [Taenia crassiceps]|uniref:Transmembrane emp24 domain-containing protein 7 n=1 Tax=Taenia crassiceps TaxID=6207 RepID=A0ABR4Q8N9_9CEST